MLACALTTAAAVVVMLVTMSKHVAMVPGIAKMTASTGFIGLAIAAGGLQNTYGRIILLALFFSWWGDFFLMFSHKNFFLFGLIAFFLGHVGFGGAFLAHGVHPGWTVGALAALCIPLIIVVRWLNPTLADMRYPVYAYIVIITMMVALSIGAWGKGGTVFMVMGAVLFYLSDLFVARGRFVTSDAWNHNLGLPLYFAAQVLMAYTVSFVK